MDIIQLLPAIVTHLWTQFTNYSACADNQPIWKEVICEQFASFHCENVGLKQLPHNFQPDSKVRLSWISDKKQWIDKLE